MPHWLWEGLFSMEIPEGWEVNDFSDGVEVLPPDPSGAAHLSVYRRVPPRPVEAGEASEWIRDFAAQQLALDVEKPQEIIISLGREASLSCIQQADEGPRSWELGIRIWDERAVFFTYNHDGSRPDLRDAALMVFASVEAHSAS